VTSRLRWHSAGMAEVPADQAWHDPALAARLQSMRFRKRRDEAELGRWTAKQALARALDFDSSDTASLQRIAIRNAADGAPEAFLDGGPAGMRIAMTDRADWAVCALLDGHGDVGCDLEIVEPRSAAFVADYFTDEEQRLVARSSDHDAMANLLWSAKESALKVLRTGLRRDTRTVDVRLEAEGASDAKWHPLEVHDLVTGTMFPGYWIRYGPFLLTVAARDPIGTPESFDEPAPLSSATPSHVWMDDPTVA
jgi:4'-phosphopantetheinyl transferase